MADELPEFDIENTTGGAENSPVSIGDGDGSGVKANVEAKANGKKAVHVFSGTDDDDFDEFYVRAALERISGVTTPLISGRNPSIGAGGEDLIGAGGTYVFPTSASTLTLESADADDTSAGTGARSVRINGLDANYDELEEDILLNGTTPVTTTNSFLRVNKTTVLSAGSSGSNEGIIITKHGTDVLSCINEGENVAQDFVYTVPAGKTLLLQSIVITSTSNNFLLSAKIRPFGGVFLSYIVIAFGNNLVSYVPRVPFSIEEKSDFIIFVNPSSGSKEVSATSQNLLVDNV